MKKATEAVNVNVSPEGAVAGARVLKSAAKLLRRNSITRMAAPAMYQYPLVTSAAIDSDTMMSIAKAYQLYYASSVVVSYSLNPIMNLADYPEVSDYVQSFHTNDKNPLQMNVNVATNTLGINMNSATEVESDDVEIAVESATLTSLSKRDVEVINARAWDYVEDKVATESLNDMYRPYDRTRRIIEEKLQKMKIANEATSGDHPNMQENGKLFQNREETTKTIVTDPDTGTRTETTVSYKNPQIPTRKENQIVRNTQLEAMEPTMVNVQIIAQKAGQPAHTIPITIGVKMMPRILSSDLMIASMVKACKETRGIIFKFLKWTKGEIKTLDYILGISKSKKKALEKGSNQELKFLEQSRKRKKLNIGRFIKNEVLPTMNIVITSYEAEKIKQLCSVDLNDLTEAIRLMNKFYLLSFAIYDTEQGILKSLFDCDNDWSYTTIGNLRSTSAKISDVYQMNQTMKLFGKR